MTDDSFADNVPGNIVLFKFKQKITGEAGADGTKIVKIMVPLKYLTLEIPEFWYRLLSHTGPLTLVSFSCQISEIVRNVK